MANDEQRLRALAENLARQWRLLWDQAKSGEALGVAQERLKVCRKLGDPALIAECLELLWTHPGGNDDEKPKFLGEALYLARQHGLQERLGALQSKMQLMRRAGLVVEVIEPDIKAGMEAQVTEPDTKEKPWWKFWG